MGSEWPLKPLESLVTIHDSKRKPIKKSERKSGPYPYYGASDIADYVDNYAFDGLYLLLSEDGDNLRTRNTPVAFTASGKFWVNNHAHVLQGADDLDTTFLCYALQYAEIDSYISGSTRPKITQTDLKKIPVRAPSMKVRHEIAKFVYDFDKKIALNRQINQTLEQMAQALFKSWFVDFDPVIDNALDAGNPIPDALTERAALRQMARTSDDFQPLPDDVRQLFPNEFEESELGWVPKGWRVKELSEVTEYIIDHRGKTPKKLGADWTSSGIPAISAKNIKNGQIVRKDMIRYVDQKLYEKWMKVPLKPQDILMTSEAPMGELYFLATECRYLLSQRLYGLRADESSITGIYLYHWLQTETAKSDLDGRATGTTVVGIRQSELKKVSVLCPNINAVKVFSKHMFQSHSQIEANVDNSQILESLRDTLLPKLISGELRLDSPEVEKAKSLAEAV